MIAPDLLKTSLLDLLYELRRTDIALILGGGYGLFLKQLHLQRHTPAQTLIPPEAWPAPRATRDLDIFLRPEIVTDTRMMQTIRTALEHLNFVVIPGCEYMQFVRPNKVKIDLLTGPLGEYEVLAKRRADQRRVGPNPSARLHARRTDEAIDFQRHSLELPIQGVLSSDQPYESSIHVSQGFTYLMTKLFAVRDRIADEGKDFARHHTMDAYRTIAMLTESEFQIVRQLSAENRGHEKVIEAGRIVARLFSSLESLGTIRLREHELYFQRMNIKLFLTALQELFPDR